MSCEAAYFPDALANSTEVGEAHRDGQETSDRPLEPTDERLLEKVSVGEREALALLFRRHARAVRNVAYRILRNGAEADDLVQDVFLFIFRKAGLYEAARGKASNWIIHVAYHRAFDRLRYLKTRHFYTCQELEDTALRLADYKREVPFHEQSMEGILGKQLMATFKARLTPEQRETIELFFFEGYPLKEIAELTGRSLVNVRSHYYRGLERLRKYVLPEKQRSK